MHKKVVSKRNLEKSILNYTLVIVLVIALGGYFGFVRYQEYAAASSSYEQEQLKMGELQANLTTLNGDYNDRKKQFDQDNAVLNASLQKIFPSHESYTNLARELDNYFLSNNTPDNPIFLSDLRFSPSRVDDKKDYSTLPFTMTISASQNSFKKFLNYIENSGDLNSGTRLMDISSISINFDNAQAVQAADGQNLINVSMAMNAYFQKPNP